MIEEEGGGCGTREERLRDISEADLIVAQATIEEEAKRAGIEPYRVLALFDRAGQFAGLERIDTRPDASTMNLRRVYWNPHGARPER